MAEPATQMTDAQIVALWAGYAPLVPRPSVNNRYTPAPTFSDSLAAALEPIKLQLNTLQNDVQAALQQIDEINKQLMILDHRHLAQCQGH